MREFEIANNDGKWVSTRRVEVGGEERDCPMSLFDTLEDVYSMTLYFFKEVDRPVPLLRTLDVTEDLRLAFWERNKSKPNLNCINT